MKRILIILLMVIAFIVVLNFVLTVVINQRKPIPDNIEFTELKRIPTGPNSYSVLVISSRACAKKFLSEHEEFQEIDYDKYTLYKAYNCEIDSINIVPLSYKELGISRFEYWLGDLLNYGPSHKSNYVLKKHIPDQIIIYKTPKIHFGNTVIDMGTLPITFDEQDGEDTTIEQTMED